MPQISGLMGKPEQQQKKHKMVYKFIYLKATEIWRNESDRREENEKKMKIYWDCIGFSWAEKSYKT